MMMIFKRTLILHSKLLRMMLKNSLMLVKVLPVKMISQSQRRKMLALPLALTLTQHLVTLAVMKRKRK